MLELEKFEKIHQKAQNIEGWFGENEAKLLYELTLNKNSEAAVVEIGSWCGKSLSYIASAVQDSNSNSPIFSIDPYLTSKNEYNGKYETFVANMTKLGFFHQITQIREKSQRVGENFSLPIALLFVDGFHQYPSVKKDFELFYPKIITNGYFVIHDVCCYEGPTRLVKEAILEEPTFKVIDFRDLSVFVQKVDSLTVQDIETNKKFLKIIEEKSKDVSLAL